jgi:simple sugar transport system ATP-binding protein
MAATSTNTSNERVHRVKGAAGRGAESRPLLRLDGVRKSYGAVEALRGIDLEVEQGSVLAICGDNGAGKSTLIRIISGAHSPDAGRIALSGASLSFASPIEALRAGIATIYQDLALAPRLPIWQNIFIGAELTRRIAPGILVLDKRRMRAEARRYLARLKIEIADTDRSVDSLSGGQRQAVAIARALHWNARLIIMDEPTAALGVAESRQVLELIRELHRGGSTIILISHNMAEVIEVATAVAILKAGRKLAELPVAGLTADTLAHLVMTGQGPA